MVSTPQEGRTIEERYELEVTRVGLGLARQQAPIPVGQDGRYLVEKLLGRGNMGAVYLAEDRTLDRHVALKVVARRLALGHSARRLEREAKALARLQHENVVTVYDLANTAQGELFIAMEYVPGVTLRTWQESKRLHEILDAYLLAGRGLAAAHDVGWIHRDFKPDNVLVDTNTSTLRVKVSDFGLAGLQEPVEPASELDEDTGPTSSPDTRGSSSAPKTDGRLTSPQGLLGSVAYMAPEQLRRERADARSDQHQFCVALWEAVVGKRPFPDEGRDAPQRVDPPARPGSMPRSLHRLLCRGLAFEPADRFASMNDLLWSLARFRGVRRALPWVAGGTGLVTALVAMAIVLPSSDRCEDPGAPMSEIWTDAAAQDIRTRLADAEPEHVDYVISSLDMAAAQWTTQTTQACNDRASAAEPAPTLDRRVVCLREWANRMRLSIERLRTLDADHVEDAHALVTPLRELDHACVLPAPPLNAKVQDAIDLAEASELLGDGAQALQQARDAVELAAKLGTPCEEHATAGDPHSSEMAAALFRLGHAQAEWGSPSMALETLNEAHLHALACGDRHRYADARIHTAARLAIDHGDLDRAALALREAESAQAQAQLPDDDPHRQEYFKAAGLVAQRRGDLEGALEQYEHGLATLGTPEDHPVLAAKLIADMGVVHQVAGRYDQAAEAYARATALVSAALGPHHVQTWARAEREALNLGIQAAERGEILVAREKLDMVARSSDPTLVALALAAWVQAEYVADQSERPALALELASRLYDHLHEHPDLSPEAAATAMTTSGQILAAFEDGRGLTLLEESLQRWRKMGDEASVRRSRLALAQALAAFGRVETAREHMEILRPAVGQEDPEFRAAFQALDLELSALAPPPPAP